MQLRAPLNTELRRNRVPILTVEFVTFQVGSVVFAAELAVLLNSCPSVTEAREAKRRRGATSFIATVPFSILKAEESELITF